MLIRFKIVGIPCLKTNAAAGYYQWVRDKRKKIYSSKPQKQLGENIWLHSLINQAQLITPLRSSVCLYLCFFLCLHLCWFVCFLFQVFLESPDWKLDVYLNGPVWNPRYISKGQDVCLNALRTASISCWGRYNCSIIALFFISSLDHRVCVCYFELIRYAWLYVSICVAYAFDDRVLVCITVNWKWT